VAECQDLSLEFGPRSEAGPNCSKEVAGRILVHAISRDR
jgi:hypothetical protein